MELLLWRLMCITHVNLSLRRLVNFVGCYYVGLYCVGYSKENLKIHMGVPSSPFSPLPPFSSPPLPPCYAIPFLSSFSPPCTPPFLLKVGPLYSS